MAEQIDEIVAIVDDCHDLLDDLADRVALLEERLQAPQKPHKIKVTRRIKPDVDPDGPSKKLRRSRTVDEPGLYGWHLPYGDFLSKL